MTYSNNFPQDIEVIDAQFTDITPTKRSFLDAILGCSSDSFQEQIQRDTEQAQFRMQLTEFSLARIGAVSVLEQHISTIAPHAADRCKAIVDASTVRTIEQIKRW